MRISVLVVTIGIAMVAMFSACSKQPADQATLDSSGVTKLLDLLDIIAAKNPNFQEVEAKLAALPVSSRRVVLDSLVQQNRNDRTISRAIEDLLASDAYKLCYAQFKNVSPKVHREILCHLPYEAIPSPGGISDVLFELFPHRAEVRAWVASYVPRIDMNRARLRALAWLPAGNYPLPPTRFYYDGNGDAFAQPEGIGVDLFGVLLYPIPKEERFARLNYITSEQLEETLAHELHHMYSRQALKDAPMESSPKWASVASLSREMVSEGLATQCNPLTGMDKEITEDPIVIAYWISDLKEHASSFALLPDNVASKRLWRESTYQDLAQYQKLAFLSRCFPGKRADSIANEMPVHRPDLAHTLGRWMVQHISKDGQDRNQAIALLQHPDSVFVWYDRAVKDMPSEMRFEWE